jgi:hypothetical protein
MLAAGAGEQLVGLLALAVLEAGVQGLTLPLELLEHRTQEVVVVVEAVTMLQLVTEVQAAPVS